LDIEGIDALIEALKIFKGGVISISHDERFITNTSNQLWVCAEGKVTKYIGDVTSYKVGQALICGRDYALINASDAHCRLYPGEDQTIM
jgi:hypothetical protein